MPQELKDKIMEALYQALGCGQQMLSIPSNDFIIQEIGNRLIYAIDNHAQPPVKLSYGECKDWAHACKMTLSSLNPPC